MLLVECPEDPHADSTPSQFRFAKVVLCKMAKGKAALAGDGWGGATC